jgi:hypothetical protein
VGICRSRSNGRRYSTFGEHGCRQPIPEHRSEKNGRGKSAKLAFDIIPVDGWRINFQLPRYAGRVVTRGDHSVIGVQHELQRLVRPQAAALKGGGTHLTICFPPCPIGPYNIPSPERGFSIQLLKVGKVDQVLPAIAFELRKEAVHVDPLSLSLD